MGADSTPSWDWGMKVHRGKTLSMVKITERGFLKVISKLSTSKNLRKQEKVN